MKNLFLVVFIFLLSSCDEPSETSSGKFSEKFETRDIFRSIKKIDAPDNPNAAGNRKVLARGTDEFINSDALQPEDPGIAKVLQRSKDKVELNLVNASVNAAAQAVLGGVLKVPFTVADDVNGRITIQTTGPIPRAVLFDLFKTGLEVNNARIEKSGDVFKIVQGKEGTRRFRDANGNFSGPSIVVAPLKFISAKQMSNLLQPSTEDGLKVTTDDKRNLLLMSGNKVQLEAALEAINLFDVDVLAGKSVALVSLEAADPENVVDELNLIFETGPGGNLENVVQFVANPRLRSILVITSRSKYLADAQKWIRDLDRTAGSVQRYSQIYELQNRSATELAPVLATLLGVKSASENSASNSGNNTEDAFVFDSDGGDIQILADDSRNAIVARALRTEHEEIRQLVARLDSSVKQVLLEATLAEVTLNDEISLGVRWFFESGNLSTTLSDVASGAVGAAYPGFSAVFSKTGAQAAISALASVTDVKIISTPSLTVLDNKEAILRIGDQVPISTRNSVDTSDPNAPIVSNIEYRDTGVILKVRPRIGNTGRVVLDIEQEVSSVAETTSSGIDSPTIRQRTIKTSVIVQNGETLALGGIIQETDNRKTSKVPGLGDIKGLGALFRSKKNKADRTELLILIRPWVIQDGADSRAVTDYWRKKLGGPNKILSTGLGQPEHSLTSVLE